MRLGASQNITGFPTALLDILFARGLRSVRPPPEYIDLVPGIPSPVGLEIGG